MKTDKYGIEIKVGDYVLLDSYTGMEYGTSAGKIVQIKKIGSRRISFDAGFKNLRSAQFEFITAYNLIGLKKVWYGDYSHYLPLFSRTANSDQVYKAIVSKLKKGTNKPTTKGVIRGNMTPGQRAKDRASKASGNPASTYKYNSKTNRATKRK